MKNLEDLSCVAPLPSPRRDTDRHVYVGNFPVRCFKSRNRKFSNRILDSTFVRSIPFFREIQTMSRDKFFWFLCLFEIRSIWKLIREVFLFFFLRNQSSKFQSQNLENFFFLYINLIYQSIQIMKKQDYLCHFVYLQVNL